MHLMTFSWLQVHWGANRKPVTLISIDNDEGTLERTDWSQWVVYISMTQSTKYWLLKKLSKMETTSRWLYNLMVLDQTTKTLDCAQSLWLQSTSCLTVKRDKGTFHVFSNSSVGEKQFLIFLSKTPVLPFQLSCRKKLRGSVLIHKSIHVAGKDI